MEACILAIPVEELAYEKLGLEHGKRMRSKLREGHGIRRSERMPCRDGKLKLGHWRELAPEEVRRLRAATDAPAREKEQRFHQE